MEHSINAFGQATINSLDPHELFHTCSLDTREAAEGLQQRRAASRADTRYILKHTALPRLLAALAVAA